MYESSYDYISTVASRGRAESLRRIGKDNISLKRIREGMLKASARGNLDAMTLFKDWGATDFNWALAEAAEEGKLAAMKLLKDWGAMDFEWALYRTVSRECTEALKLIVAFGTWTASGDRREAINLLESWIAGSKSRVSLWRAAGNYRET